jgi:predicted SprT family Zn-dependent metalloprotease
MNKTDLETMHGQRAQVPRDQHKGAIMSLPGVDAEVSRCLDVARSFAPFVQAPRITYDLVGVAAGKAYLRENRIALNLQLLAANPSHIVQTAAHEIGHLIAFQVYKHAGHGRPWRAVMMRLGRSADRCHSLDVTLVKRRIERKWLYRCVCGAEIHMGTRKRNRLEAGTRYRNLRCGHASDKWTLVDLSPKTIETLAARYAAKCDSRG